MKVSICIRWWIGKLVETKTEQRTGHGGEADKLLGSVISKPIIGGKYNWKFKKFSLI